MVVDKARLPGRDPRSERDPGHRLFPLGPQPDIMETRSLHDRDGHARAPKVQAVRGFSDSAIPVYVIFEEH